MGHILAITGDHHANSTVGLAPPEFILDDGNKVLASERQRWIWARWIAYWKSVGRVKEQSGWPVTAIMLGELADDLKHKHKTSQLISTNESDMIRLAISTLAPASHFADQIVVLRGTEAHSGVSSNLDETIAREIGASTSPLGTHSWWQYRADFDGVFIDAAHHPGFSSRVPHTAGNEAMRLASKVFYEYSIENILRSRDGRPLVNWPHLVFRGHNHRPADSIDNQPGGHPAAAIRSIITPSWQGPTAFAYRISASQVPIGGLIVTCQEGRFTVHKLFYWPSPGEFNTADGWAQMAH
jgi:hypothetical protein